MTKSSPWPKMLPPLGIALAIALLARGRVGVVERQRHDDGQRRRARRAHRHHAGRSHRSERGRLRASRGVRRACGRAARRSRACAAPSRATKRRAPTRAGWPAMRRSGSASSATSTRVLESRARFAELEAARAEVLALAPQLLVGRRQRRERLAAGRSRGQPTSSVALRARRRIAAAARALARPGGRRRRCRAAHRGRRAVSRPVRPRPARRGRARSASCRSATARRKRISRAIDQSARASPASDRRDRLGAETLTAASCRGPGVRRARPPSS